MRAEGIVTAVTKSESEQGVDFFSWHLLFFRLQSVSSNDPLAASPWTPAVLAHLVSSLGTHTVQKWRWLRPIMYRTYYTPRRRTPPRIRASPPERTCATPHAPTRVRDRSHAHANRTRDGTDRTHRQLVTARRYTGLTVTFFPPGRE